MSGTEERNHARSAAHLRCAIYTRKSAAPPLNQEVTYLQSQQHKSWAELPKVYEDAGRTGANMNRVALQELLADIEEAPVR